MKKVFLYGYYGCGNVGDDLLLSVVASQVLAWSPEARIIIKCLNPPPLSGERIQFEQCEQILADPDLPRWQKVWRYCHRVWKALKGVSLFIFGGGTLFHAEQGSPINLMLLLAVVGMARLRGAQVLAMGVGVSPLCGVIPRLLMSALLLLSRDVAVRDASSLECCSALAGRGRVRQTADLVFLTNFPPRIFRKTRERVIGLTLAASAIRHQSGEYGNALKELASALNQLEKEGWTLRFLSFQELIIGDFQLSDSLLLESLRGAGLEAKIALIKLNSGRDQLAAVFSDLDMVIGMRFHGLVLAGISGIPFIGMGKDHKLAALCSQYDFPYIPFDQLRAEKLISAADALKEKIPDSQVTCELRLAARENFRFFQEQLLREKEPQVRSNG